MTRLLKMKQQEKIIICSWLVYLQQNLLQKSKWIGYCIVKPRPKSPNPQGPAPTQSNPVKISSKGTGADTKILGHPTTPPPHHPTL